MKCDAFEGINYCREINNYPSEEINKERERERGAALRLMSPVLRDNISSRVKGMKKRKRKKTRKEKKKTKGREMRQKSHLRVT